MRRLALWASAVGFLVLAAPVRAQESAPADSTQEESGGILSAIGAVSSSGAAADSIARALEERGPVAPRPTETLWKRLAPKSVASVRSDLQRIALQGELSANLPILFGASGSASYTATNTSYRQQDRDQEQRAFKSTITDTIPVLGKFDVRIARDTNYDENRPRSGSTIVIDYAETNASIGFGGTRDLGDGFTHSWSAGGDFEDVDQINRAVRNDRSLAGLGLTTQWSKKSSFADITARYGYNRATGSRFLFGLEADASAERDTLAVKSTLRPLKRLELTLDAQRATFTEDRLDFARNASGQVDTARAVVKVADEHERSVTKTVDMKIVRARANRWLSFLGNARQSRTETEFTFSQQGLVLRDEASLEFGAWLAYAQAGSVQVVYSYRDRSVNRRIKGAADFRGKDSQRAYEARMKLQQRLFRQSDLEFSASETLDQSIFGDPTNTGDRDRLYDRFDLKIQSDAIPYVGITVSGKMSQEQQRNIDASRVSSNKDDRLFEVSTRYTVDPPGGVFFTQSYRMQIKFVDQLASNDRDQFNKQGQVDTTLDYDFVSGVTTRFQYVLDFRSTGTRDASILDREVYETTQRRFDHRIRGEVKVPLHWVDFSIRSERGYLTEERQRGDTDESSGRINMKISGSQTWWNGRVTLALDAERVLQFGPRVRDEGRDYWVANTSLTVQF